MWSCGSRWVVDFDGNMIWAGSRVVCLTLWHRSVSHQHRKCLQRLDLSFCVSRSRQATCPETELILCFDDNLPSDSTTVNLYLCYVLVSHSEARFTTNCQQLSLSPFVKTQIRFSCWIRKSLLVGPICSWQE